MLCSRCTDNSCVNVYIDAFSLNGRLIISVFFTWTHTSPAVSTGSAAQCEMKGSRSRPAPLLVSAGDRSGSERHNGKIRRQSLHHVWIMWMTAAAALCVTVGEEDYACTIRRPFSSTSPAAEIQLHSSPHLTAAVILNDFTPSLPLNHHHQRSEVNRHVTIWPSAQ